LGIVALADSITIYLHLGTTDNNTGGVFKPAIATSNATLHPPDTGDGVHYVQYNGKKYYYASPLKRAIQTSKIIKNGSNIEISVVENFREINVDDLGKNKADDNSWRIYFSVISECHSGKNTT